MSPKINTSNHKDHFQALMDMGFTKCGQWSHADDKLKANLLAKHESTKNVLYMFSAAQQVLYIGKTINTLKRRMYGYENPAETQSTNKKANAAIKEAIQLSQTRIDIYVLPDNGLLKYGGYHVNLAAGLEDSLIENVAPTWNRTGNPNKKAHSQSETRTPHSDRFYWSEGDIEVLPADLPSN